MILTSNFPHINEQPEERSDLENLQGYSLRKIKEKTPAPNLAAKNRDRIIAHVGQTMNQVINDLFILESFYNDEIIDDLYVVVGNQNSGKTYGLVIIINVNGDADTITQCGEIDWL